MNNIIQQVQISPTIGLYILDFNIESNELIFRTTEIPKLVQTEKITIDNDVVYTNLYHFPIGYLHKFLIENNIVKEQENEI
jgi:hypothetical protein